MSVVYMEYKNTSVVSEAIVSPGVEGENRVQEVFTPLLTGSLWPLPTSIQRLRESRHRQDNHSLIRGYIGSRLVFVHYRIKCPHMYTGRPGAEEHTDLEQV